MKCFLINLDKNPDRLAYMDKQLKALEIEYERFSGIYGASLSEKELENWFSPFRSFCVEGRRLVPGEIGCALSHVGVYRKIIADGLDVAFVMEDDVKFLRELPLTLKKIEGFLNPNRPQVVMLSCHGYGFELNPRKPNGMEKIVGATSADAYCITKSAATLLLESNYPIVSVADRWSRWRKHLGLELYRFWPVVAAQDREKWHVGLSDIGVEHRELHGVRNALHKVNRCWQIAIDNVLFLLRGR